MKTRDFIVALTLTAGLMQAGWAQSTTGSRSGGSTASTGTGYLTEGKRPATSSAQSMTIADEGSSRDYMYVPPASTPKNRAASPDGSATTGSATTIQTQATQPKSGTKASTPKRSSSPQ
ncbi:hypothetical protein [Spirosoma sp. KNUC1025]|uniref:hypothetical protein n=1 Tax=Spirosoma sp. KNUC1025 TaxID=2894082 RepID=UPI003868964D|nr:hypothetical protein LN737_18770 [Spirosoma sp. KNUC1025]